MGCCGSKPPADENESNAINKDRKCRDVIFLILFAAFWAGMLYVASIAFTEGNPKRLMYGLDSHGNLCGSASTFNNSDYDFNNRKQLYYYNPMLAADMTSFTSMMALPSICVDGCPTEFCPLSDLSAAISSLDPNNKCLQNKYFFCDYYKYSGLELEGVGEWETQYFEKLSVSQKLSSLLPGSGPCFPVFLDTVNFLHRCVPNPPPEMLDYLAATPAPTAAGAPTAAAAAAANATDNNLGLDVDTIRTVVNNISQSRDYLQDYLTDVYKAWAVILVAGVMGAVVLSMVWMTIVRYCAGCMAWTTVFLVNIILIALCLFCALKSGLIESQAKVGADYVEQAGGRTFGLENPAEKDREYFEYATYVTAAIAGLILLLTILLAKRIAIAVACLKVASQAVSTMPLILFFPLVTFAMTLALVTYWIVVMAFLYSCGEVVQRPDGGYQIDWDDTLRYMMAYHFFGLLWTNQFIVGFGLMVIAGSIAQFYWSKGDTKNMPMAPITTAVMRTCWYHLGSIALGAFIVAVIQFVRVVLEYIDRKTKDLQEANPIYKYLMCCVKYCMWYLEKVMKFINRNAYIIVATKGTSYCSSAIRAMKLIIANVLRLAAVNTVGDILIWLGKIVVAGGCGVLAFFMTDMPMYTDVDSDTFLTSPILPIFLTVLIAYFIGELFMQVYAMAVDTILLSFCEDCEQTDGNPKYAPKLLMDALGKPANSNKVSPKDKASEE